MRSRWLLLALVAAFATVGIPKSSSATTSWSGNVDPDDPTTWTSDTDARVGKTADGELVVDAGSSVTSRSPDIGYDPGVTGSVTVTGAGSTWACIGDLDVGVNGNGTLAISDGGTVSNAWGLVGCNAGSTGRVTVDGDGSTFSNRKELAIGERGNGSMLITNGGLVTSTGETYVGEGTGSKGEVTVSGVNSTWCVKSSLSVGSYGSGTLNIQDGGLVAPERFWVGGHAVGEVVISAGGHASSRSGYLGYYAEGTGSITVSGAGSTFVSEQELWIGNNGNGRFTVTDSGAVETALAYVAREPDSSGVLTVRGADSTWINQNGLAIGDGGSGTLVITNGGFVRCDAWLSMDEDGSGDDSINMAAGGMLALCGEADDSLADFLGLIDGVGTIRFWDSAGSEWADLARGLPGVDYTLTYVEEVDADLCGYTVLTVWAAPEPGAILMLLTGTTTLLARRNRRIAFPEIR